MTRYTSELLNPSSFLVSDIAIFVMKRDVKFQPTNQRSSLPFTNHSKTASKPPSGGDAESI